MPVAFALLWVVTGSRLEPLVLSETERQVSDNWVERGTTARGLALRVRIAPTCAEGGPTVAAEPPGLG